ncbi:MAG: bifunctional glutamate N-acetyltransferase/amino-acid acetyltransferase ArgJ [Bacillota bacterium]|nr:bifunctional glutamate N-acetyltransferase/amino-acid acetyltransferase ArgJ [Bacillota bacterium]
MLIMKVLEDKIFTDIKGYKACGISAGLKKSGKKDFCIMFSEVPAVSAATFTTNKVKAAPVLLNMEHIKNSNTQAIVVNSGNANSCTGETGLKNACKMAELTAASLNLVSQEVLVGSTGVIGVPLPMDKITYGIIESCKNLSYNGGFDAAAAIMTTDTFQKTIMVETEINGKKILIGGIAKGSGMIHPNMGTMFSFLFSDVKISKKMLQKALSDSVDLSYNMVSVDGDTSTNDMVIALANGLADNDDIVEEGQAFDSFKEALHLANTTLSKYIAKDGEGATKLLEVNLTGAKTEKDAKLCAKSIITSSLVKSAFFGSDANWGRIMCALGYSDGEFDPDKVDVTFNNEIGELQLVKNGCAADFDEALAKEILDQDTINIYIDLNDGEYSATAWGCDLTYDYVKINGMYRT